MSGKRKACIIINVRANNVSYYESPTTGLCLGLKAQGRGDENRVFDTNVDTPSGPVLVSAMFPFHILLPFIIPIVVVPTVVMPVAGE